MTPQECDAWFEHVDHVIIEADGSRRRPFKAPADYEPVVPSTTTTMVSVIGADALAAMKPTAILVNTARGPLVDYDALYEALTAKRIRGAMLETFAVEPTPPDWPLLQLPNVTLTPHIAGASLKTVRTAAAKAAEEVRRWLVGESPLNPC